MGIYLKCLAVAGVLGLGLAIAEVAADKATPSAEIKAAIAEIMALSSGLSCQEPQAWTISGSLNMAAQFLAEELVRRGWDLLQHGQLKQSYAVVADPNPGDPNAVAIGGFMLGSSTTSEVFLAQCAVVSPNDTNMGPPVDPRFG